MILLLINFLLLFVFVSIIYFFMKRKDSSAFQIVFDHYTQLGVLVTLGLIILNSIMLLDAGIKLQLLYLLTIAADFISPFWVPLFLFLIGKHIDKESLKRSIQKAAVLSLVIILFTYYAIITRFVYLLNVF